MANVKRLVTFADVDDRDSSRADVELIDGRVLRPAQMSVSARHELELSDGRRVLLLNDRGWSSSGGWAETSVEDIQETTRMVVGPDAPYGGRSEEDMEIEHWAYLQKIAERRGVAVRAAELRQLPHDVELSQRLRARIGADPDTGPSD